MLYGSETWTIAKLAQKRIEAFEIWCYRKMLKIIWVDMVTNKEVLEIMAEKELCVIVSRKGEINGLDMY